MLFKQAVVSPSKAHPALSHKQERGVHEQGVRDLLSPDGNPARVRSYRDAATGGCLGKRWNNVKWDGAMHPDGFRPTKVSVEKPNTNHGIPDQQGSSRKIEERHDVQFPSQQRRVRTFGSSALEISSVLILVRRIFNRHVWGGRLVGYCSHHQDVAYDLQPRDEARGGVKERDISGNPCRLPAAGTGGRQCFGESLTLRKGRPTTGYSGVFTSPVALNMPIDNISAFDVCRISSKARRASREASKDHISRSTPYQWETNNPRRQRRALNMELRIKQSQAEHR